MTQHHLTAANGAHAIDPLAFFSPPIPGLLVTTLCPIKELFQQKHHAQDKPFPTVLA